MGLTPVVELMISKGLADLTDKEKCIFFCLRVKSLTCFESVQFQECVLLLACGGGHGDTAVLLIKKRAHLDCSDVGNSLCDELLFVVGVLYRNCRSRIVISVCTFFLNCREGVKLLCVRIKQIIVL